MQTIVGLLRARLCGEINAITVIRQIRNFHVPVNYTKSNEYMYGAKNVFNLKETLEIQF